MTTIAANAVISLGLASTRGKFVTVGKARSGPSSRMVCPVCRDESVRQFYVGDGCSCPVPGLESVKGEPDLFRHVLGTPVGWTQGQVPTKLVHGALTAVVDRSEVREAAKPDLPAAHLELRVHHADQVLEQTWPNGRVYLFEPATVDDFYSVLVDRVGADPRKVYVGLMSIKGAVGWWRLLSYRGALVVQGLARPEEVGDFTGPEVAPEARYVKMMTELAEAVLEDFDPSDYSSDLPERLAALVAAKAEDSTAAPVPAAPAAKAPALEAVLEASLAAVRGKRAPAKRAKRERVKT